jgi:hypothetical protein
MIIMIIRLGQDYSFKSTKKMHTEQNVNKGMLVICCPLN